MRLHYETEENRAAELEIGEAFAKWKGVKLRKLPEGPRYSVDFSAFKGKNMVAIIEVKDRPTWMPSYDDVILSVYKVGQLYSYHQMGSIALFVVRLPHGIYWVRINDRVKLYQISWMGRSDRGDKDDKEPCAHIPLSHFREVPSDQR